MLKTLKKYAIWGIVGAGFYFLMSYHIIIDGRDMYLLEKTTPTLEYTFYSLKDKKIEKIMSIDNLREDGIGDLLVELGFLTEEEKNEWERTFAYADEDEDT